MQPNTPIQQLTELLQKPATVSEAHCSMLTDLAARYPYFKPLHLLLAKAGQQLPDHDRLLAKASLYNGGSIVHAVMTRPETLHTLISFHSGASETETVTPEQHTPAVTDEQETFEEIAEVETAVFKTDAVMEDPVATDEIFEEINEIDTDAFRDSSDFFAFEKDFHTEPAAPELKEENVAVWQPEEYNLEAEAQSRVSKYDDDKLPYTFLWWLAKTRKEHEQIFQPYVSEKKQVQPQTGELQQQYIEHIFHLQTPFDLKENMQKEQVSPQPKMRDSAIIDNFIKNEPQIKAPKAEQINTENKAKKSAEDHYDLVSETLASIYIEQMLYHKAIDTYQKLSLKFPEKSRYFADLIQSLEKKI